MSICAGIVVAVAFEQIDRSPYSKTCAKGNDQRLQYFDCGVEEFHVFSSSRFDFVVIKTALLGSCFLVRDGHFVNLVHVIRLDFEFGRQKALDVKRILGVIIRQVLIVWVFGDVVLVREKGRTPRSCRMHLPPSITAISSWLISSFPSF